jgi:GMP synthase (glutamine-hydrolysing)
VPVLVVDNNVIDKHFCADIRRYLAQPSLEITVRRGPEDDLPSDPRAFSHVILSGSKTSILESSPWVRNQIDFIRRAVEAGTPLLGICYGHQLIARAFGGEAVVRRSPSPEFGWVEVRQSRPNPLLAGLPPVFHSFQSHFEDVRSAPAGFEVTASSERCPIQAFRIEGKPAFGIQFHPERDAGEGQRSIDEKKKGVPRDCIFGDGKAESLYTENVARTIFGNLLASGPAKGSR